MTRVHAVVLACGEQNRRIAVARRGLVVGGITLQKYPVLRLAWITIFRNPTRTGEQLAVTAHVDQRDGAKQGPKTLGVASQHVGDENAAVRATFRRNALRAGDTAFYEIRRHGREIVVRNRFALQPAGIVPARTELATAPDVGRDTRATALQPEFADGSVVVG